MSTFIELMNFKLAASLLLLQWLSKWGPLTPAAAHCLGTRCYRCKFWGPPFRLAEWEIGGGLSTLYFSESPWVMLSQPSVRSAMLKKERDQVFHRRISDISSLACIYHIAVGAQ